MTRLVLPTRTTPHEQYEDYRPDERNKDGTDTAEAIREEGEHIVLSPALIRMALLCG
ncbi:MAG TPA: hypothetical protein VIH43_00150 [Chthoniobacterales bacterium]